MNILPNAPVLFLPIPADFSETSLEQAMITAARQLVNGKQVPSPRPIAIIGDHEVAETWTQILCAHRKDPSQWSLVAGIRFGMAPAALLQQRWAICFNDGTWVVSGPNCVAPQ